MRKIIIIITLLFAITNLQTTYFSTCHGAEGTYYYDFISVTDWKNGKVSPSQSVLSFNEGRDVTDIIFVKDENGKTIFGVQKNEQIIGVKEFPALYSISVKQIREKNTGKYFYIVNLCYDTSVEPRSFL